MRPYAASRDARPLDVVWEVAGKDRIVPRRRFSCGGILALEAKRQRQSQRKASEAGRRGSAAGDFTRCNDETKGADNLKVIATKASRTDLEDRGTKVGNQSIPTRDPSGRRPNSRHGPPEGGPYER